jgi:hypothetical protein
MSEQSKIAWTEIRDDEVFYVIAELTSEGWSCFERSTWEVAWYPARLTPQLVNKAESLLRKPMCA